MINSKLAGLIAASATALALGGAAFAADAPSGSSGSAVGAKDMVHCYGVNSCKGQSDCKSGNHDCKGQNDCKGQGFKAMTAKACKTAGGSLTAPN